MDDSRAAASAANGADAGPASGAAETAAPGAAGDYCFDRLGLDDLPALVALERRCFSMPWGEREFRLGLAGGVFKVFGLRGPQGLAAYISFHHVLDEMEVLNIAVHPHLRRRGLGARLLGLALGICAGLGVRHAHLEVRMGNAPARALYARFGFVQAGLRRGYYTDTGEDAVLMALELSAPGAAAANDAAPGLDKFGAA
ncbi:ribosomal protein S18-alanine N-acetyltransferase [Desulfocurvus vexinensis]|uniref:ribosomal protein S18-alanine N-acetyltransferase n=1 Tax=Desulfocurvus vexinensis TaxID=399548 RepID=UPI0009FF3B26|nr:ribosomal protein S18-alanine N-acetyltransferase [Desulfocurvus vexinensis]